MHYDSYVKQFEIRIVCSIYFTVSNAGQCLVLSLTEYILIESWSLTMRQSSCLEMLGVSDPVIWPHIPQLWRFLFCLSWINVSFMSLLGSVRKVSTRETVHIIHYIKTKVNQDTAHSAFVVWVFVPRSWSEGSTFPKNSNFLPFGMVSCRRKLGYSLWCLLQLMCSQRRLFWSGIRRVILSKERCSSWTRWRSLLNGYRMLKKVSVIVNLLAPELFF